jgi:putative ABC transport system ATP-binding protein
MTAGGCSISCRGITKTFGSGDATVHALRGVELEARWGEVMALVGPSGCGKTTLISILAGLLQRDQGELSVLGDDPSSMGAHERTKWRGRNVGFIFQQFNLIPQVSVVENVAVPLLLQGTPRRDALDRSAALLAEVGLKGRERSRPTKLSGGQQQRVAIARALVSNPRLLVCDEPTSALDVSIQSQILNLLQDLQASLGLTYLFISHNLAVVRHLAHRVAVMHRGVLVETGDAEQIFADPQHAYTRQLIAAAPG